MRRELTDLARREGMSVNQFISMAVAEKMARLEMENSRPLKPSEAPPHDIKLN